MNNEENLVIHTFNTDIEEELKKKDANILDIAIANNNHIEPTEPPNYRAILTVFILFLLMALSYYAINLYIKKIEREDYAVNQNNNIAASSTVAAVGETLQNLMPSSYNSLYPYIDFNSRNRNYLIYKINNYDGLVNILISNENSIKIDMQKYFSRDEILGDFKDLAYNNWDMRIASSTNINKANVLIYAIANKKYVIFADDLKSWESAYNIINK